MRPKSRIFNLFILFALLASACGGPLPTASKTSAPTPQATQNPTASGTQPTTGPTQAPLPRKPNIILILADDLDQRLGTMEYIPNIHKLLSEQGMTFADFFVTNSLCCPSRSTILRGQYTHNHQVYTNRPPSGGFEKFLDQGLEDSTVAIWLQESGYRTVLMGKYLNGYPEEEEPGHLPPGWSEWYSPSSGKPYGNYNYELNENGELVSYGDQPDDYLTDVLAGKAVDFIQRAASDQTPFFLYVAPYVPHSPATPAPRHADLFPNVQAPRTPSFAEEDLSDKPTSTRQKAVLDEKSIRQMDRLYRLRLQSMQAVDEMVAQLVETLQASGQLDNTYIFFTSDNGFHMGQHGLRSGKTTAYEEDINVPLIVRGPGVSAGEVLSGYLTGNVDLAPTFADLAGVNIPDFVDGRSLEPLFASSRPSLAEWRQAFLLESYQGDRRPEETGWLPRLASLNPSAGVLEPADPTDLDGPGAAYSGLRTTSYKYVEYADGGREFYDLLQDPYELDNLADQLSPALAQQLSDWLKRLHTCAAAGCRAVEQEPAPHWEGLDASLAPATALPSLIPSTAEAASFLDIPYAQFPGSEPNLNSLDIYAPIEGSQHPIMIFVHGGGWQRGDKDSVGYKPEAFNAQGFVFVSINYRLMPQTSVPEQAGDVAKAIAWMHAHAAEYGGDPDVIFLMGHSAGAHLVSLVGTNEAYLEAEGLGLESIQGVVSLDTQAYDVTAVMKNLPLFGGDIYRRAFGDDPSLWEQVSPANYVASGKGIPPFLVAYTGQQETRRAASEQFVQKLQEADVMAEILPAPNKTHGEINRQLGQAGDVVTQAVFAFLRRILEALG